MTRFVLASHNAKKLREMEAILGELGTAVEILPEGAPEAAETGTTFEENALIKARSAMLFTGLPAIADDSGLCVDALGGAPGVYSARYGSAEYFDYAEKHGLRVGLEPLAPGASDEDRTLRLLRNMALVPDGERQARFVSAICCIWPGEEQNAVIVRGECGGEITRRMQGAGGFGYDPVFYVPEHGCTFGELPAAVKNQISHRARALQKLKAALEKRI
ncbi:RdgB/HAM1 family non-canonical purine NTP pyrophosphatase [Agathobaculum sp.]|uniref:RdgB/HAM1 family non-canonical purine NTP pyrophosphatase n=1 Tax=Agathobaculum sp. TaxID=2048138 RepID=UPI002A81BF1E|nr:RdgB/HAM1 family non-canonical purine NTP pyrophosphatase [Agathobaculum sp.]MDY3618584.1 RdgB/HAM1 family non-canonical purine NTP pyrophosphatase [Agathobaculum sp.]